MPPIRPCPNTALLLKTLPIDTLRLRGCVCLWHNPPDKPRKQIAPFLALRPGRESGLFLILAAGCETVTDRLSGNYPEREPRQRPTGVEKLLVFVSDPGLVLLEQHKTYQAQPAPDSRHKESGFFHFPAHPLGRES